MPSASYDLNISAARAGALFASPLQRSDEPGARQVRQAIATAIGVRGCAASVAQAYGEHLETAVTRMRWALTAVATAFGGRRRPARGARAEDHRQRRAATGRHADLRLRDREERGGQLVNNLMTDAITTQRWYLVVAMGRSAGYLALGIGKSAGATLAVIAEEFPATSPSGCRAWWTSSRPRCSNGSPMAPLRRGGARRGIGLRLPQDELQKAMPEVERDDHGHVRPAELEPDRLLAKQVKDRFKERGEKVTVEGKNIGSELRCAPPIPFDIDYIRDLGCGAADYLKALDDWVRLIRAVTSTPWPGSCSGGLSSRD